MMKETLNEEQLKQARKESADAFNYAVWVVSPKPSTVTTPNPLMVIPPKLPTVTPSVTESSSATEQTSACVEAERFVDARTFACRLFGVSEVVISKHVTPGRKPIPRWQVKFAGHAAGANNVRMQSRQITAENGNPQWIDTREM